jgi:hypothetical protein
VFVSLHTIIFQLNGCWLMADVIDIWVGKVCKKTSYNKINTIIYNDNLLKCSLSLSSSKKTAGCWSKTYWFFD